MATDRPHRAAVAVAAVWQGSAMPAAPPALELARDQVVGWRLRRHHLDERAPGGDLLAVVAEIAGLHAQIMSSAELGDKLRHSWGSPLKPAASLGLLCFGPSDGQLVRFTRAAGVARRPGPGGRAAGDGPALPARLRGGHARGLRPLVGDAGAGGWQGAEAPRRRGRPRQGRGVRRLDARRRRRGDRRGVAGPLGAAAASVRPVRRRRHPARRAAHARAVQGPRLPAAGLALPRPARPRPHARHLAPGPQGRRLQVTIEPFAKLPTTVRRQAEHEAERLATWTGATLDLAWADLQG